MEAEIGQGILRQHAYGVIDVQSLVGGQRLLRLRNPWGSSHEWSGAWSDASPEAEDSEEDILSTFSTLTRRRGGAVVFEADPYSLESDDGTFLIALEDWCNFFTHLVVCVDHDAATWHSARAPWNAWGPTCGPYLTNHSYSAKKEEDAAALRLWRNNPVYVLDVAAGGAKTKGKTKTSSGGSAALSPGNPAEWVTVEIHVRQWDGRGDGGSGSIDTTVTAGGRVASSQMPGIGWHLCTWAPSKGGAGGARKPQDPGKVIPFTRSPTQQPHYKKALANVCVVELRAGQSYAIVPSCAQTAVRAPRETRGARGAKAGKGAKGAKGARKTGKGSENGKESESKIGSGSESESESGARFIVEAFSKDVSVHLRLADDAVQNSPRTAEDTGIAASSSVLRAPTLVGASFVAHQIDDLHTRVEATTEDDPRRNGASAYHGASSSPQRGSPVGMGGSGGGGRTPTSMHSPSHGGGGGGGGEWDAMESKDDEVLDGDAIAFKGGVHMIVDDAATEAKYDAAGGGGGRDGHDGPGEVGEDERWGGRGGQRSLQGSPTRHGRRDHMYYEGDKMGAGRRGGDDGASSRGPPRREASRFMLVTVTESMEPYGLAFDMQWADGPSDVPPCTLELDAEDLEVKGGDGRRKGGGGGEKCLREKGLCLNLCCAIRHCVGCVLTRVVKRSALH